MGFDQALQRLTGTTNMLIGSIVAGWIVLAVVMGARAMKNAEEPLLMECFDCKRDSCAGCPFLEKARLEMQSDLQIEERRLAA